jgi:hypothetical protein
MSPVSTVPRLLTVASEEHLYELLAALNVSGINPEVACLFADKPFLATLTDPDADHVEYVQTDEGGRIHCCNCHEHRPIDCAEANWEPRYPVQALLTEEPDADRAREDDIDVWWSA